MPTLQRMRIDKAYHNLLSMQSKLQDMLKSTLTTADVEKKSPGRDLGIPKKITEYERSKRTLTPVRNNEPNCKKPMRLLLPKPVKRSLPSPQTRTGLTPAAKRTTIQSHAHPQIPLASRIDPDSEPSTRVSSRGMCPTVLPFYQEEIAIKVYEDVEDDEEESVKVC